MNEHEQFIQVKFNSWRDLAKYVIEGGEVYHQNVRIQCDNGVFNLYFTDFLMNNLQVKKQPTLEELIAIKPRLCWVWDDCDNPNKNKTIALIDSFKNGRYYGGDSPFAWWYCAEMLTNDEIKSFLNTIEII